MANSLAIVIFLAVFIASAKPSEVSDTDNEHEENLKEGKSLRLRQDFVHERGPYEGGDMVIPAEQKKLMRSDAAIKSGIIGQRYRWPGGKIFFQMDSSFNKREQNLILYAMREIQNSTCIRFHWRERKSPAWVYIRRGSGYGCWSYVGKQGGGQLLNLQAPNCMNKGTIIHELMHAVGFFHEQSRPDRDSYVTVNWPNILRREQYNFEKYGLNYVDTQGLRYDYKSIMHYSGYAFARDPRRPTLFPKMPGMKPGELGQYKGLTQLDAEKINAMYRGVCP